MQIESQAFLTCETNLHPNNVFMQDGDTGVIASTQCYVPQQQPAKKPTRQWAAWTRQEEESFFTALRQVGKNFEKITCRVQSKNKDQVRHYYYRLVRRMNKLLGPGLCLDAKNSKDTNAAMLRWWSLLEKYSCKASKLHLKPRRFKIFIEALENQLLKDRKKNVKRRDSPGDNCSPTAPTTISSQSRPAGHDTRTVKLVLVDGQNIQKLGPGKGSFKRSASIGANHISSKKDSTVLKTARQRRRPVVSSVAYKKWEKAAIAGVSLVADAAEHLERKDSDKEADNEQGGNGFDPVRNDTPPLPNFSRSLVVESNIHSSAKLKLQLFPIDDGTRTALEMDKHNPYLELTLSARKKISSVLEHLNRKWGDSSAASGKLMLFPYVVRRENLVGYQRWAQDSAANAADVYAILGSPPLFRLRYGWLSNTELRSVTSKSAVESCCILDEHNINMENRENQFMDSVPLPPPPTNQQSKNNIVESPDLATNTPRRRRERGGETITRQADHVDATRLSNCAALSAVEWADSLTNVSVGDLLSEVPDGEANDIETLAAVGNSQCLQQVPFSCDSFDAAIAAHISKHQGNMGFQTTLAPHASLIWDAEETCDAFAFQKNRVHAQSHAPSFLDISSPESRQKIAITDSKLPVEERPLDDDADGDPSDEVLPDVPAQDSSAKDFNGLTDMYWPDSLGPLDLPISPSKYHNQDLILSDSLSGLNRLIASSLDAFQNCLFFGMDKKEHRVQ